MTRSSLMLRIIGIDFIILNIHDSSHSNHVYIISSTMYLVFCSTLVMFTSFRQSIMYSAILESFLKESRHIELIYTSHPLWPLQSPASRVPGSESGHPDVALSVLDSSFNPPTKAHLALALLPAPSGPFTAKLLLYSMKNADKAPKTEDATPSQRLQMMVLLAKELQALDVGSQNVAVAVCQEPTFASKSNVLHLFLRQRMRELSSEGTKARLTFLLGYDTLERLFSPRYYGSEQNMDAALRGLLTASGDDSRVLCARRSAGASYLQADSGFLQVAEKYIDSGAVVMTDIGETEKALSSSEVREGVRSGFATWETLVPSSIAAYIKENNLYR